MSPLRVSELKNRQKAYERKYSTGAPRLEIGPVTYVVLSIIAVTTMALIFLAQSNKLATRGYDLADLKRRQEELRAENERLMVEITRSQSINETKRNLDKESAYGMVYANGVVYAPKTPSAVAVR